MISVKNVTVTFKKGADDSVTPLKDFCMEVSKGETVILEGPSGSGKSTLLSLICAISKPDSGEVTADGVAVSKLPEHFAALYRREKTGMIFQKYHLIENMSVRDNVMLPLLPADKKGQNTDQRVDDLLSMFRLADKASVHADRLSGGEMQRTAIARALVNDPEIILADEPTANLDMTLTSELLGILKTLKEQGKTILIATHDKAFSDSGIADQIIRMEKKV